MPLVIVGLLMVAGLMVAVLRNSSQAEEARRVAERRSDDMSYALMLYGKHAANCMELMPLDSFDDPLACTCYLRKFVR